MLKRGRRPAALTPRHRRLPTDYRSDSETVGILHAGSAVPQSKFPAHRHRQLTRSCGLGGRGLFDEWRGRGDRGAESVRGEKRSCAKLTNTLVQPFGRRSTPMGGRRPKPKNARAIGESALPLPVGHHRNRFRSFDFGGRPRRARTCLERLTANRSRAFALGWSYLALDLSARLLLWPGAGRGATGLPLQAGRCEPQSGGRRRVESGRISRAHENAGLRRLFAETWNPSPPRSRSGAKAMSLKQIRHAHGRGLWGPARSRSGEIEEGMKLLQAGRRVTAAVVPRLSSSSSSSLGRYMQDDIDGPHSMAGQTGPAINFQLRPHGARAPLPGASAKGATVMAAKSALRPAGGF